MRIAISVALVVAATSIGASARADEKSACLTTYVDGQALRKEERLRAAAAAFRVCAEPACPVRLSQNCLIWLREVEGELPSIVVAVTQGGRARTDLHVEIDGEAAAATTDGKPLPVDPGARRVRVFGPDVDVTRSVTVRKGEPPREVRIEVAADGGLLAPKARPIPPLVYVLGGVGAAGLGVFGYFGIRGLDERSTLDQCRGHCDPSFRDRAASHFVFADIGLGVAAVAITSAVIVWLTRPERPIVTETASE
jgi:hypothetical protein